MLKFESYTEKYLLSMVDMTIENYGNSESISNIDFVRHEYFENPSGNALIELAIDDENDTLAGQYIVNPHDYMFFGRQITGVLSLNTLTRKKYRGQKVFTTLAENCYEKSKNKQIAFCYGAPNPNSYPGFKKKLNFNDLCEMPLYVRLLKPSTVVREKINKFLSLFAYPFNLLFLKKKIVDNNIIEIDSSNVKIMDEFWNLIKDKYKIIGVRNSSYINYRYLNIPTREYYLHVYLVNKKPIAFVAARIRDVAKIKTGMIADFLFVEGYEKEAKVLINYICNKIHDLGVGLSGCIMMTHTDEAKILKKAKFIRCPDKILPQPTPLIIRVFDEKLIEEGIMDVKNWFFTTGDYDVV